VSKHKAGRAQSARLIGNLRAVQRCVSGKARSSHQSAALQSLQPIHTKANATPATSRGMDASQARQRKAEGTKPRPGVFPGPKVFANRDRHVRSPRQDRIRINVSAIVRARPGSGSSSPCQPRRRKQTSIRPRPPESLLFLLPPTTLPSPSLPLYPIQPLPLSPNSLFKQALFKLPSINTTASVNQALRYD
jgi:hypothetical protein